MAKLRKIQEVMQADPEKLFTLLYRIVTDYRSLEWKLKMLFRKTKEALKGPLERMNLIDLTLGFASAAPGSFSSNRRAM